MKLKEINERMKAYDEKEKERKRKIREELKNKTNLKKTQTLENNNKKGKNDIVSELDDQDCEPAKCGIPIKPNVIKEYDVPIFKPYPEKPLRTYTNRFRKFSEILYFIDKIKTYRSSEYCTILPLAETSKFLLKIWSSSGGVRNAIELMKEINLISVENDEYHHNPAHKEFSVCKTYRYFVEVEREFINFCDEHNIKKIKISEVLEVKNANQVVKKIDDLVSFTHKDVIFKSNMRLSKPDTISEREFIEYLTLCLYENYPEFKYFQKLAEHINETYYKDTPEFQISFKPNFHWNKPDSKKSKAKPHTKITKIGIRATNKLCNASKEKSSKEGIPLKRDIISVNKFDLEFDVKCSVPRLVYGLSHNKLLDWDVDFYELIYKEFNPDGTDSDFKEEREYIKTLLLRTYFENSNERLNRDINRKIIHDDINNEDLYLTLKTLYIATEKVLGCKKYNNFIFYAESCVYMDALFYLLQKGFKVWQVYDGFYANGDEIHVSREEFKKNIQLAIQLSFERFKFANNFRCWVEIYNEKDFV